MKKVILFLIITLGFSNCSSVSTTNAFPINRIIQTNLIEQKSEDTKCEEYYIYLETADSILSQYNTKMTGRMLAESWHSTLENFGVDVPVKLALAQAHLESGFCRSELSIQKNNPYSLRSGKSYARYSSLQQGVDSYYKLIAKNYLSCKNIDQLLKNFSTCDGYRYAGSKNYEIKLKNQIKEYDLILAKN